MNNQEPQLGYRCGDVDTEEAILTPLCNNQIDQTTYEIIQDDDDGVCMRGYCYNINTIARLINRYNGPIDPNTKRPFTYAFRLPELPPPVLRQLWEIQEEQARREEEGIPPEVEPAEAAALPEQALEQARLNPAFLGQLPLPFDYNVNDDPALLDGEELNFLQDALSDGEELNFLQDFNVAQQQRVQDRFEARRRENYRRQARSRSRER